MADDVATEGLVVKSIALASGGWTVHTDDFFSRAVHDRDYRQRIGVEVCIFIVFGLVLGENQALHVSAIVVGEIQSTIGPGLDDYIKAFREIKVRQRLLK